MATLLAELDPAVYVLDCLPNMTAAEVAERVEPLVRTPRKAHPEAPIVMAEDRKAMPEVQWTMNGRLGRSSPGNRGEAPFSGGIIRATITASLLPVGLRNHAVS
jgi:hypothetical protein